MIRQPRMRILRNPNPKVIMQTKPIRPDPSWIRYCERDESEPSIPRTVVIGEFEWAAHNLNVSRFRNGDPIPEARSAAEWIEACRCETPAWCTYDNDPAPAEANGKLYNRFAVEDPRGLAPAGWSIPDYAHWHALVEALGPETGRKLKSVVGWSPDNGENAFGFNALPAGSRYANGGFYGMGEYANFAVRGNHRFYVTGIGALIGGFPRELGGRGNAAHGHDGISVRLVRPNPCKGFRVIPGGVPNPGILFVDRESTGRSGHMGNAVTACSNGDILAFYGNTSGIMRGGHLTDGWTEYRRSTDGGRSWAEPIGFPYSKAVWETNRLHAKCDTFKSRMVTAAVTAPNGNVLVFSCFGGEKARVHLSRDHGQTWSAEPLPIGGEADDPRLNYDAVFVHGNTIYALFLEGVEGQLKGHAPLALYVSTDNGESFTKRCGDLFSDVTYQWYQTGRVLDDGRLVVYVYDIVGDLEYLRYALSDDDGQSWSEPKVMHLEKRIRNPQLSDKLGGLYFMHGRSGSRGVERGNLVLYRSTDGLNWDAGVYLNKREGVEAPSGAQAYSSNTVVGGHDPSGPQRLLIQSSISYAGTRVNTKHWWIAVDDAFSL